MRVENQKKLRVAINGFGRIGRNFLRCWEGRENSLLDVVAINDSGGVKQASHLLKYDSTLGKFDAEVKIVDDATLAVNGKNIKIVSSRDPLSLPWKEMDIDLVIEGTGVFLDTPGAGKHLQVGAGGRVLRGGGWWLAGGIGCIPTRPGRASTCRWGLGGPGGPGGPAGGSGGDARPRGAQWGRTARAPRCMNSRAAPHAGTSNPAVQGVAARALQRDPLSAEPGG